MIKFFLYNWQVRDEWFHWCKQIPVEELLKDRKGGAGSILYTLFHIVDVEYSWLRGIQGEKDVNFQFTDYQTLGKVKSFSDRCRIELDNFIKEVNLDEGKNELVCVPWVVDNHTRDQIIHHIIAHEIHHIGQLSIWARELDLIPVPANFIGRELPPIYS